MKDEDIKLPELPNADLLHRFLSSPTFRSFYSPEQMTEYAREAVRLNQPIATNNQLLPFDLEAAKRGEAIITRDGRKARFLAHEPDFRESGRVICTVDDLDEVADYYESGAYYSSNTCNLGLFMAPKPKRVVYLNVHKNKDQLTGLTGFLTEHHAKMFAADAEIIALPVELP